MPGFTVNLLAEGLNDIGKSVKATKIAVLGLSYKPNINDCRESPSFKIISHLKKRGAKIIAFDPHVPELSDEKELKVVFQKADVILIATGHKEFLSLNPKILEKYKIDLVIDGRNCLDKKLFDESKIIYKGIGRP